MAKGNIYFEENLYFENHQTLLVRVEGQSDNSRTHFVVFERVINDEKRRFQTSHILHVEPIPEGCSERVIVMLETLMKEFREDLKRNLLDSFMRTISSVIDALRNQIRLIKYSYYQQTGEPQNFEDSPDKYKLKGETIRVLPTEDFSSSINLPSPEVSSFEIDLLLDAVNDFMVALGFELVGEEEPVYGSFFTNLWYKLKGKKTEKEIADLFETGKSALKAQQVNLPTAEATQKLTAAASELIRALEGQDRAVIRLGTILVVKLVRNGEQLLVIETISPVLMEELDKNSSIMKNPDAVYDLLQGKPTTFPELDS